VQRRDALSRWGTLAFVISSTSACAGASTKPSQASVAKPALVAPALPEQLPDMIELSGATFMMGGVYTKTHRETVADFDIGRTEVTTSAYRKCVAAGACAAPSGIELDDFAPSEQCRQTLANECNFARTDREQHPINCVTAGQAEAYCKWRGQRLPTEPEWELAARGTTARKHPWGDSPWTPERANLCDERCLRVLHCPFAPVSTTLRDGYLTSAPVGSFPKGQTPSGIEDMVGNLEEITSTIGHGDSSLVSLKPGNIGRGGSWASDEDIAFRSEISPTLAMPQVGFRCARSPQTERK
jgi:formylglycine-generating enzyme required for sulfatase activity